MSTSADALIRRLDSVENRPDAVELRALSYDLLHPRPGPASGPVVDVGCGTGRAVAELAGRGVRAVGVDLDERMIAAARRRWPGADLRVADALALPFEDGELAGYRADKVLHDLAEPERALAEARRALAPGGRAVLVGQDWDGLLIDSGLPALTRTIVHARADLVRHPRAGRAQRGLLLDGGFEDVTVEVRTQVLTGAAVLPIVLDAVEACRTAGAVTGAEAGAWADDQRERARTGRLCVAVPFFVTAATRP
ncbi:methyltransferase domain-containing protein [Actinomadura viridis]|uniref:SAM-dependent methyltransferase n=1 Tax=Actinomadura viridis TaxID=58110 RepID=A0A931DRT5_9ACTN|nr:methyltransferase domain-containing protein [Actinomadura viridis]MBG6092250.1 SAM-dependent methyltransferase [Actinomadura viridis]